MRILLSPPLSLEAPPLPAPLTAGHVTVGATLCRLQLWSADRWAATPAAERPANAEFFPGLGWVVAEPECCLN